MAKAKVGAGHAEAMFRLGFNELRELGNPQLQSVVQPLQPGVIGNPTPGEVAKDRAVGPTQEPQEMEME